MEVSNFLCYYELEFIVYSTLQKQGFKTKKLKINKNLLSVLPKTRTKGMNANILSVLVSFPDLMIKYPHESNLGETGHTLAYNKIL